MHRFHKNRFGTIVAVRTIVPALLVVALYCGSGNLASAAKDPGAFVQSLGDEVVAILKAGNGTQERRRARFRQLFSNYFDVPAMARFVASRYWRRMSDPQKREYLELFRDYVANIYAVQFSKYTGETFEVVRQRKLDDRVTDVKTRILRPNGPALAIDFRVASSGDELKITDVVVEAISLLVTKRSEFQSVLRHRGVEGFLQTLRDQVAK